MGARIPDNVEIRLHPLHLPLSPAIRTKVVSLVPGQEEQEGSSACSTASEGEFQEATGQRGGQLLRCELPSNWLRRKQADLGIQVLLLFFSVTLDAVALFVVSFSQTPKQALVGE